ncbi:MAG TPA: hypothetical protein V6C71_08285 [Coleofasciculaceae cyanobacterium]|jgi:SRSO17 transposase
MFRLTNTDADRRIEECFQFEKSHLGLADYEVRSWTGWHRHTALVLAAGAFCLFYALNSKHFQKFRVIPFF